MTATATNYKYILLDELNIPFIEGTTMKIVELITSVKAYGWTVEELHANYPHLTLSQIYSALAYYWDYKEEIEADLQQRELYVERMQQKAGESQLVKKLRSKGLIQ